ncbi:MAG: AEC family transporter [Chloroflexia bacterium]
MADLLNIFLRVLLPLTVVWGAGFLARRVGRLDPRPFSRLALYFLAPAIVFVSLMETQVTAGEAGRIFLSVVLLFAIVLTFSWGIGRLLRLPPPEHSGFVLASLLINSTNYGFPVVLLAFGNPGLERATVFAIGAALLANSLGVYVAARGHAGGAKEALRQVLQVPMVYGVLLALLLRLLGAQAGDALLVGGQQIGWLTSLYRGVKILSQAAIPVFSLVLGMQLAGDKRAPFSWRMLLAGMTRLAVSPLVAWGLVRLLGLSGLSAQVTILEAAMPTAVISVILSTEFDTAPRFVSTVVVGTTLASLFTLTIVLHLLGA